MTENRGQKSEDGRWRTEGGARMGPRQKSRRSTTVGINDFFKLVLDNGR